MREAIRLFYSNYFNFSTRTSRRDYWLTQMYLIAGTVLMPILTVITGTGLLMAVWSLGNIIPSLSIAVRRFHDRNYSAWVLLVAFIPGIGTFILLFLILLEGTPGPNRYGFPTDATYYYYERRKHSSSHVNDYEEPYSNRNAGAYNRKKASSDEDDEWDDF